MRQVYLSIRILLLVLFTATNAVNGATLNDSTIDAKAASIRAKLAAQIAVNERLIQEGKASQANYMIMDDEPAPVSFFTHFTNDKVRKIWINNGWFGESMTNGDISWDIDRVNTWISELRKTYLDNTQYKDYKIYFVLSGMYKYDNIDLEENIDWATVRTISFDNEIKDKSTTDLSGSEKKIVYSVLNKIINVPGNTAFANIFKKDKYIVCFFFNMYKYGLAQYSVQVAQANSDQTTARITTRNRPQAFLMDGYFHSPGIDQNLINALKSYNTAHLTGDVPDAQNTLEGRANFVSQSIRNVFTFLGSQSGVSLANLNCAQLLPRLEQLYATPLPNATTTIEGSMVDLSLDTRKCLLTDLSNSTLCGDGSNRLLQVNYCENIIMDIFRSTPEDQRKPLLSFLNENNGVLRRIITKINDPHKVLGVSTGGDDNFTNMVDTLSQWAYRAYDNELSAISKKVDNCTYLSYDPEAEYNSNSNNVVAKYTTDDSLRFTFRNYNGPCGYQQIDRNGNVSYGEIEFARGPFEFVGIMPTTYLPFQFKVNGQQVAKRQKVFVPAILLYSNILKTTLRGPAEKLEYIYEVSTFFLEGPFILTEGSTLANILKFSSDATSLASLVANAPKIKARILSDPDGQKMLDAIDVISNHQSIIGNIHDPESIESSTVTALYEVIDFWVKLKKDAEVCSDPKFGQINVFISAAQKALVEDKRMYLNDKRAKAAEIDGLFLPIKFEEGYQAFREFYINDPLSTIELAGPDWDAQVAAWRDRNLYNISGTKNIARLIYPFGEYLCTSSKQYSPNMENAKADKFIPKSFYTLMDDDNNRVFKPTTYLKKWDTDIIALEYYAAEQKKKGRNPADIEETITMYTDLITCPSCSYVLWQFRQMFPKVRLHIVTTTKIHY
ncbi:The BURPS668_1122 family of deaminases [Chitinophaga sp. YR573]|uniref:deaminase domain-containing protein n=1 Tax=Chitinophaga sp. YR573 TaxID=1881040 RepID=UPI0008BE4534|nr:deaminase domain-containing protein [Chitinophaga sp. YR573]SEW29271.1 The BURPS668_1122 family of deaminases [Chitinophaga sp. YR573]